MNKGELVEAVSTKVSNGASRREVEDTVNAVLDTIKESLAQGEAVQLTGFGNFEIRSRGARQGRNPQTGEPMTIAASRGVGFKAGKGLRDAVNTNGAKKTAKKAGKKAAGKKAAGKKAAGKKAAGKKAGKKAAGKKATKKTAKKTAKKAAKKR